jgi:hypothetical protein
VTTPSPCNNSTPSTYNLTGGLSGYTVGTGYDQVTGLGSLDVYGFAQAVYGAGTKTLPMAVWPDGLNTYNGLRESIPAIYLYGGFPDQYPYQMVTPLPTGYYQFFDNGWPIYGALTLPSTNSGGADFNGVPTESLVGGQFGGSASGAGGSYPVNVSFTTADKLQVLYFGDKNYTPTISNTALPIQPSLYMDYTLTYDQPNPALGVPVNFTVTPVLAALDPSAPTPTGTVYLVYLTGSGQKVVLAQASGTAPWVLPNVVFPGPASYGAGTYNTYVFYEGDLNYDASHSSTATPIVVSAAKDTLAVAQPSSVFATIPVTYTFTLHAASTSTALPTGSATVYNTTAPTTIYGTSSKWTQVSEGVFTATVSASYPTANGALPITLAFAGDSNYPALSQVVSYINVQARPYPTITMNTNPSIVSPGDEVTAIAYVTVPTGAPVPNGQVTFHYLSPGGGNYTFTGSALNLITGSEYGSTANSPKFTTPGVYSFQAELDNDTTYTTPSVSKAVSVTVGSTITSATVSAAQTTTSPGVPDNITLTIVVPSGQPAPTGLVTFTDSTTSTTLGTSTFVATSGTTYASTLAATFASGGTHTVGASYAGDANYPPAYPSGSAVVTVATPVLTPLLTTAVTTTSVGATDPLTLKLTSSISTSTMPTGVVTFTDGTTTLCSSSTYTALGGGVWTVTCNAVYTTAALHTPFATFGGDSVYAKQTSNSVNVGVTKNASTLIAPAMTTTAYGTAAGIAVTVSPGSASLVPTGSVTYTIGTGPTQTVALAGGSGTIPVSATQPVGTYSVVIGYAGDSAFNASTNITISLTVTKPTPTLTWATPAAITYATPLSSVQLNAASSVAGTYNYSPAAGTVLQAGTQMLSVSFVPSDTTDYNNGNATVQLVVKPAALSVKAADASRSFGAANPNFTATITGTVNNDVLAAAASTSATSSSAAGTYSIVPTVSGAHIGSYTVTPTNGTLTITQAGTTTAMVASPTSLNAGQNITLTATITPATSGTPTGTVTFVSGGTTIGTATLVNGVATYSTTSLGGGSFAIAAVYGGDTNFTGSTSTTTAVTVAGPTATVAATVAQTTISVGATDALHLTLTPSGSVVPTGNVSFFDNGTLLGTASLSPSGSTYVAALTPTFNTAGANVITMTYSGGSGYAAQTTTGIAINVNKNTASVSLPANSSFAYGIGGTIGITVSPQGTAIVPTGSITATIGAGAPQTSALSNGAAAISVPTTQAIGTYTVSIAYSGDGTFNTATAAGMLAITRAAATLTWATPAAITYGTALSATQLDATASVPGSFVYTPSAGTVPGAGTQMLTATFSPTDNVNYATATATVQLLVNPAPLAVRAANATRSYGSPNPAFTAAVSGAVNGDIFTASASTTATQTSSAGTYAITPSVAGPALANYTVTPTNGTLTITQASSSAALTASSTALNAGATETLTATVATATNGSPTGTVQFLSGSTVLGTAPISNGVATFVTTALPAGVDTVSAVYTGDVNFSGSNSSGVTITVTAPDFSVSVSPSSLTVKQGGAGTATITVSSVGGFNQAMSFACSGTLPPGAACVFAPTTITAVSGSSVSTVLTFSTTAPLQGLNNPAPGPWRHESGIGFALLFPGLLVLSSMRRRRFIMLPVLLLCLSSLAALSGCGTHSDTTTPTPVGTYGVTVSVSTGASGGHTAGLSINVTQ